MWIHALKRFTTTVGTDQVEALVHSLDSCPFGIYSSSFVSTVPHRLVPYQAARGNQRRKLAIVCWAAASESGNGNTSAER